MKSRRHPIDARRLLTVDEHGPTIDIAAQGWLKGAIVRVMPSANATDIELETLKRDLAEAGVAAVRVMPRAAGRKLAVADLGAIAVDDQGVAIQTPRELVRDMVALSSSKRKAELTALIERLADAEGI
jgi:hypothetical protein